MKNDEGGQEIGEKGDDEMRDEEAARTEQKEGAEEEEEGLY